MAKRYQSLLKFIKDPIHGEIDIPLEFSVIDDLLNTNEIKRLNRIYQLGECFNVFPGAVHTRFSHSLGVYNNAKKFIEALEHEVNIPLADKKVILCAALLHDVGHGPRSHCFEKWTNHKHEAMTNLIINSPQSEVYKVLKKHKINPEEVCSIISHKHKHKFYYQIVSSQIDSDRMDYLLRDSHFTGARYGDIDPGMLFKWVYVVNDEIVFDQKAIGIIQDILFSRMQMSKQIYFNHRVVCYETLLGKIFLRFKDLYKKNFKFKDKFNLYYLLDPFVKNKKWDLEHFLALDDDSLGLIIKSWNEEDDEILKKLTNNYLYKNDFTCSGIVAGKVNKSDPYFYKYIDDADFTIYNDKEKIMIKTDHGIKELIKIKDESFLFNENLIEIKLYFYEKK